MIKQSAGIPGALLGERTRAQTSADPWFSALLYLGSFRYVSKGFSKGFSKQAYRDRSRGMAGQAFGAPQGET